MGSREGQVNASADIDGETPRARWTKGRIALAVALVLGGGAVFVCFYPLASPDGAYYDPYIGSIGDSYRVFEKGSLIIRSPESGPDDFIGTYKEEGGRWVLSDGRGQPMPLAFKATALGIKLDAPTSQPPRFLFRRSFAWIPKLRWWIDEHF